MAKYQKKPVVIEAVTFEEFIEYGKQNGWNIVNGMPWSFEYNGHPVTHENDECYLIPTLEGTMNFTPDDMLITGVSGEIYPCKKDIFAKTYEAILLEEHKQVKDAYADRENNIESYQKTLEEIKEAYEYGQPNHEGEVMVEVEDTCNAMYQLAVEATTGKICK